MTDAPIGGANVAEMVAFLKRTGYTQARIAAEAGVSPSTVCALVKRGGDGLRTPELYDAIARLYARRFREVNGLLSSDAER